MKTTSHEKIIEYLNKVCADRTFEKSPRNVRLLKFLVDKAIKGEDVNQYVIGLELFEQNYQPEQNDSKVRVYMFNLRKKLEEYYDVSGKHDDLLFKLDKGQYNLKFSEEREETKEQGTGSKKELGKRNVRTRLLYLAIFLVFVILLVIGGVSHLFEKTYCWSNFFAKDADNICILADQVICWQPVGSKFDPRIKEHINSEADFIKYKEQYPDDSLRLANYSLFSKMAPYAVKSLNTWFINHKSDFSMRQESRLEIEELRKNNVLYIGQFKTMSVSKSIFLKDSKKFKMRFSPHGFVYNEEDKWLECTPKTQEGVQVEYAMVSYFKLNTGKTALYFVSNNDIGVMATVNNFTNAEWLADFYSKLPSNDAYFNALFEVSGVRRTEMSCKLVAIEVLK